MQHKSASDAEPMSTMLDSSSSHPKTITILGAGVIGLTTAFLLSTSTAKHNYNITVLASHMPGDYSPSYASPWAGANFDTYSTLGSRANDLERHTWPHLSDLAQNHPEAGIHFQETKCVMRSKDRGGDKYLGFSNSKANHPYLKHWTVPKEDLEEGVDGIVVFESVCINTAIYLPWLVSRCLERGVIFKRGIVRHVCDAASGVNGESEADIVINCTGLGAKSLGGVEDEKMFPVRGQTVLVREESDAMYSVSGVDGPDGDWDYLMTRAAGGGTVLGGCAQPGNWDGEVDLALAERIKERAVKTCPALTKGKEINGSEGLSVIRNGVGLRPSREGGPRIEREILNGIEVVHCYGHGGCGYQQSYASAAKVVDLIETVFEKGGRTSSIMIQSNLNY